MINIPDTPQEESELLQSLANELNKYGRMDPAQMSRQDQKEYIALLKKIVQLYDERKKDHCCRNIEAENRAWNLLQELASRAIDQLGGATPCIVSLKHYNSEKYGPFLGISNDGEDVEIIKNAAIMSPKARVLGAVEPIVLGMAVDAERLAAVGEVAVGPPEYKKIYLERGCLLTTTNVGTRANVRYLKQRILVEVPPGARNQVLYKVIKRMADSLKPYFNKNTRESRPNIVFLHFEALRKGRCLDIIESVSRHMKEGKFCDSNYHQIGLHVKVAPGKEGFEKALRAMDIAYSAGISNVSLEGQWSKEAQDKISLPGLLNYFNADYSTALLQYANKLGINLTPWNLVDLDTVARHIAGGLGYARNMGLEMGKYGLFPLTLPESLEVIKLIQQWFAEWTAAPALYVDLPIVGDDKVYTEKDTMNGIRQWMANAGEAGVKVVLLDTADKDKKRRIMKENDEDGIGILTRSEITEINSFAKKFDIKVLWAGGITLQQAFAFGQLGVFGIYVTSAASEPRPVRKGYIRDIMLSHSNVPTLDGVVRTKLLLEAGFLLSRLKGAGLDHYHYTDHLNILVQEFTISLAIESQSNKINRQQNKLDILVEKGWRNIFEPNK